MKRETAAKIREAEKKMGAVVLGDALPRAAGDIVAGACEKTIEDEEVHLIRAIARLVAYVEHEP